MKLLATVEHTDSGDWLIKFPSVPECAIREEDRELAFAKARSAVKRSLETRAGIKLNVEFELVPFCVFGERKKEKITWTGETERIEALIREAQSRRLVKGKEHFGRFNSPGMSFYLRNGWSNAPARLRGPERPSCSNGGKDGISQPIRLRGV